MDKSPKVFLSHIRDAIIQDVDLKIVWATVKNDLPPLKRALAGLLESSN